MNKRQRELMRLAGMEEAKVLNAIEKGLKESMEQLDDKIRLLEMKVQTESVKNQIRYQKTVQSQVGELFGKMQNGWYKDVESYVKDCYEDGFLGTMYDLHGQGVPLVIPMNQQDMLNAIINDTKLSKSLYESMGINVKSMVRSVNNEVARGVSMGSNYIDMARNIKRKASVGMKRTMTIARTEGHRVRVLATSDAQKKAKDQGAEIVKQWDASLDKKTRQSHRELDGQIKELEEEFVVDSTGKTVPYPSGFGIAEEDINCRCALLQRAKWALDDEELKSLESRAKEYGLDKTPSFQEFKQRYLQAAQMEYTENKNSFNPEVLAGAVKGKPMTFDEANHMKANPNFKLDEGYRINCQSCVVSYEARLRGYDVETLPNTKGSMLERLAQNTNLAWIDPITGKHPEYIMDDNANTVKKLYGFLKENIEKGKRYTIEFAWKGRDMTGHIVHIDKDDNDILRLYDPQGGKLITNRGVVEYFKDIKFSTTVYGHKFNLPVKVMRVDDKMFNVDVVNQIMEAAKNADG